MRHSAAIIALVVAACGRLDFGASANRDGAIRTTTDGARDGMSDAAGDGCLASYLLCDGFETSSLASWWNPSASGVELDATVAHRGMQSLHLHTDDIAANDGSDANVNERVTFAGSGTFYVRAFVRMSAVPVDNLGLIEADQTGTPAPDGDGVFATSSGLTVFSQFSERSMDAGFTPTNDAWTCVIWTVTRATDTSGSLALDGDATASLTGIQTDGDPPLGQMEFGIQFAGPTDAMAQPAIDVWLDDVIVAASPLTCAD